MVGTCVDSDLAMLFSLEKFHLLCNHIPWADQMLMESCKLGLRFLRMFFCSLLTLKHTDDAEFRQILTSLVDTCGNMWEKSRWLIVAPPSSENPYLLFKYWMLDVQARIQHCKQTFGEPCELLLRNSLTSNSFKMKHILKFLDAIIKNLKDLNKCKTVDEIVLFNNQIQTLEKKLRLLHDIFNLTPKKFRNFKEMRELKVVGHAFARHSAILVFLYWAKEVDEEKAAHLNILLINVLQKIKPCYIRFLKEMKLMQLDSLLLGRIIQNILDLLLENLVDISKDDFQILQESLMFVIAFLANPPDHHEEDEKLMMITAEIEVLVKEPLDLVLSIDDMKGNSSEANTCLSDFIRKVELVKGKIRRVYGQNRELVTYDFPNTNGLGFFDLLLQNLGFLKGKMKSDMNFIPFAKHLVIDIEEELMSLRPYLNALFEQQKVEKKINDTWSKVINLAYRTEYAINSCSVIGHQLRYNIAHLMEVLDEIKVVKSNPMKVEGKNTHDGEVLHSSAVELNKVLEYPRTSRFNEVMVGLEDEIDKIVENLIAGSKSLNIVAIVGMPGLGKTTVVNKVYNAHAVRKYFHKFAYCIISHVHDARRILIDILRDIKGKDEKLDDMMEEDLAHMLYKCLKGNKFLIIMDDIWDVTAWDGIERSLPDDQNGSRVIFTTRIQHVALQTKKDYILHHLRFLSEEESWELLRRKAFHAEGCPPDFSEVGKMIANNCKGLPLTIVLIGGLLARTDRSLSRWIEISKAIGSNVSPEGCMDVLELSYQRLPEHLKPCFLYFGAFSEDTLIRVDKLTLLWIAEGFVQNPNNENLENVAKEYLCDLVDRSLVIVNERSSYRGIKSCQIHDLVYEFCQGKAQELFFQSIDGYEALGSSSSTVRDSYRVCINMKGKYLRYDSEMCPIIHSLLRSCKRGIDGHYYPYFGNLKLVQVMDAEEIEWKACFISDIASIVHLRFSATSFPLELIVPSSISSLWNLEILILTGDRSFDITLPETIWNMTRLRHVDVGRCYISSLGVEKREAYPQMVNLESFSSPNIYTTEDLEDLQQRMPFLRKLSFQYNYAEEPIKNFDYVRTYDVSTYDVESLSRFHFLQLVSLSKLESLKVSYVGPPQCYLRSFDFPSTLKKLSLSYCYLSWSYSQALSKMPCLEVLKLLDYAFVGHKWDMEDIEFPKLKFLKLEGLNMSNWIAWDESFPSLEVLIVTKCQNLNAIPHCFGKILTLTRVEVYASRKVATSVVEIQEAQKELGNKELQVIVSNSREQKSTTSLMKKIEKLECKGHQIENVVEKLKEGQRSTQDMNNELFC